MVRYDFCDRMAWIGAPLPALMAPVTLKAGADEYKYVLDATRWRQDPSNLNQGGGYYHNSVLKLGKTPASGRGSRTTTKING